MIKTRRLSNFIIVVIACISGPVVNSCPMSLPTTTVYISSTSLTLDIAAVPGARQCGLSRRDTLAMDRGMLFVVPEPVVLDFWMADTKLSLSIAFLDADGRILSIQDMSPQNRRQHYRSPARAKYAIEVNQGWFEASGTVPGDIINIQLPVNLQIR